MCHTVAGMMKCVQMSREQTELGAIELVRE